MSMASSSGRSWSALLVLLATMLALVWSGPSSAQEPTVDRKAVPAELQPWIDWVADNELPPGNCRNHDGAVICVWPTNAAIVVADDGGSFTLDVLANHTELVTLVGDDDAWPQDVRVDGKPALVLDDGGAPQVAVEPGSHRVTGRWVWTEAPDQLSLPDEIALVELVVEGVEIRFPSRADGLLDVPVVAPEGEDEDEDEGDEDEDDEGEDEGDEGEDGGEDEVVDEPDSERIEVSRLIRDGVPLEIETRVDLRISGQARELILPYPLWADAKLLRIDSDLPVSLDADDQLVVQARSGSYSITLRAQLPRSPSELGPPALAEPWPADEVWVWQAAQQGAGLASMGQVAVTGTPVDRSRTHAPTDWPEGATYAVTSATPLGFEVLQRGVSETVSSELRLRRTAVFDLSGAGWFVFDDIRGTMNGTSRLDLEAGALGRVLVRGTPQVITVNGEGQPGVELREPAVELTAQWQHAGGPGTLPLAGWSENFADATVEFELPRGWDLLYVSGPGRTSKTWLDTWEALAAILLLGVCVGLGVWVDRRAAGVALIGLALVYHPTDDGFYAVLVLLGVLAGVHAALQREHGIWLTRGLHAVWWVGVLVIAAWAVTALPRDLERVWRQGAPALGQLRIESADEVVQEWVMLAMLGAALVVGGAVAIDKLGGRVPKLALPILGVLALAAAGLLLVEGGYEPDMAASNTRKQAEVDDEPPPEDEYRYDDDEAGGTGQRHKGEEGKLGKSRNTAAPEAPGAYAVGNDDADVWGGLANAEEISDEFGVGGLGLVGTGRGGGGTGEGTIGLGNTGLIGKGGGGGTGSGYGRGSGAGFGGRGKRIPQVRQGKATVDGGLDKDIVRRVVRAHINEVRSCYNAGLTKDPNLEGRVEIEWTIGPDGKVKASAVGSSTVKDSAVANCVAKAAKRWNFPKPTGGGSVTVRYPFTLSGGGGGDGGESSEEAPTRYLDGALPDAPPPEIPQTGAAEPDWNGRVWTVKLDREVEPGEQLELVLLSPTMNKLIALIRALALAGLAVLLLRVGAGRKPPGSTDAGKPVAEPGAKAGSAAALALLAWTALAPATAEAAPPKELLDELSIRVNREPDLAPDPDCGDACALVAKLRVDVADGRLSLDAEVHMAGPGVFEIPGPLTAWAPSEIRVDDERALAVVAVDNRLLVRMDEGLHRVVVRGPIAGDLLNLALGVQPKRVEVTAEGWSVTGVDERQTATNLELVREGGGEGADGEDGEGGEDGGEGSTEPDDPISEPATDDSKRRELPVWLVIDREIEIGPRWSMRTTVRRLNQGDNPIKVKIPLLEGEQLIESSRKLEDPKATVTLERGDDSVTWTSVLDTRETIVLAAPADGQWTERWTLVCGAAWQCDAKGVPASMRDGARSSYHPWPGETLEVALFKPTPAEGATLSVDEAELALRLGDNGTAATLTLAVRTSTVGERTITLPEGARLEAVRVDGNEIPTAKDSLAIRLTFQPGAHTVRIEWKQDDGWSSVYRTPAVSLGGEAINAWVRVELDDEDQEPVLLRTGGTGEGPRVWLWAWLLGVALVGLTLHRVVGKHGVLKLPDWLLLGFGFPFVALPLVVGWFVLVDRRKRLVAPAATDPTGAARRYNLVQLAILLLTPVVVLLALATAKTLLTELIWTMPDNFYGDTLTWYADHTDDAMPQGTVVSVPASLWRVLGFAWVGWFGWRSVAWFKWFRGEVGDGGWLRWPPAVARSGQPAEKIEAGAGLTAKPEPDAKVTQIDAPTAGEGEPGSAVDAELDE